MIEIRLQGTKAQGRCAKIDDEDLELVKGKRWIYNQGYAISAGIGGMHRFILGCTEANRIVDHINGDRLDNTRANLRIVSRWQNKNNAKIPRVPTEHEGIMFDTFKERYAVILYDNQHRVILGEYGTIDEAVAVRDAEEKHGGFTRTRQLHHDTDTSSAGR
jgi:HNH endonuclease